MNAHPTVNSPSPDRVSSEAVRAQMVAERLRLLEADSLETARINLDRGAISQSAYDREVAAWSGWADREINRLGLLNSGAA